MVVCDFCHKERNDFEVTQTYGQRRICALCVRTNGQKPAFSLFTDLCGGCECQEASHLCECFGCNTKMRLCNSCVAHGHCLDCCKKGLHLK